MAAHFDLPTHHGTSNSWLLPEKCATLLLNYVEKNCFELTGMIRHPASGKTTLSTMSICIVPKKHDAPLDEPP